MAVSYGPTLQTKLRDLGIDLDTATIGSSALARAKETAALLFPHHKDHLHVMPHFTEHGAIPENTPTGGLNHKPDWTAFLKHLAKLPGHQFVIVGHGSYLKSVTGHSTFKNLEAVMLDGILSPSGKLTSVTVSIPYTGSVEATAPGDKCVLSAALTKEIATHTRKMPARKTHRKRHVSRRKQHSRTARKQQGGSYNMPLAYFHNGAQFHGTTADPTGVGIGNAGGEWARSPIQQTGGSKQCGGFPPSIMGSFAANGLKYALPMASYSGYKLFTRKNSRA
jgi:hypothetical protein